MSSCELYDQLWARLQREQDRGSSEIVLVKLADQINGFDRYSMEMTFVLIRLYALRHGDNKGFTPPYEGKIEQTMQDESGSWSDVSFPLEKFPEDLLRLLHEFTKMVASTVGPGGSNRAKPKSPRSEAGPRSFMKKMPRSQPTIVLRGIDIAELDKTYSMSEMLSQSDQNLFSEWKEEPSTRIDQIGIINEPSDAHLLVIRRPSEDRRDVSGSAHRCHYCTLWIPREWLPIEVYDGWFCSFHCARSYSMMEHKPASQVFETYKVLVSSRVPQIPPSPDRKLLEKFGGSLGEEEYREMLGYPIPILDVCQSAINPVCVTVDANDGYSSYKSRLTSNAITFKEASRPSGLLTGEAMMQMKTGRIYKAN